MQAGRLDQARDLGGEVRVTHGAADQFALPGQLAQPGERPHEQILPLARREAADAEQARRLAVGGGQRQGGYARLHDCDACVRDAESGEPARSEGAGGDDALRGAQRGAFARIQAGALRGAQPALVAERVMDQGDECEAVALADRDLGQAAEREAVHEHSAPRGDCVQGARERGARGGVGAREASGQAVHRDRPAESAQFCDDVGVVQVAARALRRIAGHDEVERAAHAMGLGRVRAGAGRRTAGGAELTARLRSSPRRCAIRAG